MQGRSESVTAEPRRPSSIRLLVLVAIGAVLAVLSVSTEVAAIGDVGGYAATWGWGYWAVPASVVLPALAIACGVGCGVLAWRRPRSGGPAWLVFGWLVANVVYLLLPLRS